MPTPADLQKRFIKVFDQLARHRDRYEVLTDFLDMAVCAVRKQTVPDGPAADVLEEQYMAVVRRNRPEDVRAMPELLGIAALALQDGGCDFLGQVVIALELPNKHMGQYFTPYDVSRMIAEVTLREAAALAADKGFVTVMEPASGAGGMVIAAADVIEAQGLDIGQQLYVDATDISPMCFKMTYLQAALRGIPATIRRGNTLSLEMFDQPVTPAFVPFYAKHQAAFEAWRREAATRAPEPPRAATTAEPAPGPSPDRPAARRIDPALYRRQPGLFD